MISHPRLYVLFESSIADCKIQRGVGVDQANVRDARFGRDAVKLRLLCAVLVIVRLRFGGKDKPVVILGHIDDIALREDHRPFADAVLPIGRVRELDHIALTVYAHGVDVIILAALRIAVCGGRGKPHSGIVIVKLALRICHVVALRNRALGDVADSVKLKLADATSQ